MTSITYTEINRVASRTELAAFAPVQGMDSSPLGVATLPQDVITPSQSVEASSSQGVDSSPQGVGGSLRGVGEWHAMVHITDTMLPFAAQLEELEQAVDCLRKTLPADVVPRFARFFLSDAATQSAAVQAAWAACGWTADCPLSLVQQPPLDRTKICLWVYLATPSQSPYVQSFAAGLTAEGANSEVQTRTIFLDYEERLQREGLELERDCARTWLFVRDVDVNYGGVVRGRREVFDRLGMTADTHYIASTGIQGQLADAETLVMMDAYTVGGLQAEQKTYLIAPTHLNPTSEYGVTFERGVRLAYGDRAHLIISGTASIDNRGEIVHPNDIARQTHRMLENVEVLLQEGGSTMDEVVHQIVYLRDMADYDVVCGIMNERFPKMPKVFLLAPVCRPGWLVEMECVAISKQTDIRFPAL